MAAGVIYQTVTTTTGETVELAFYVDDTGTPTQWTPVSRISDISLIGGVAPNANGRAAAASSTPVVLSNEDAEPRTSGGLSIFRSLDLDESEEAIKATAGQLYKIRITNNATSTRYVKLYDDTVANVAVGTTTPVDTIVVPPASASNPTVLTESFGGIGVSFANAITAAATTALADNDTGAPSANDVVVTAYYK
jgi:hypothetical protein